MPTINTASRQSHRVSPLVAASLALAILAGTASAQRSTPVQVTAPSAIPNAAVGTSVAIDGDTMVIGMPGDGNGGSALVYVWKGSGWILETILSPGAGASRFGDSVAIYSDTIVVGDGAYSAPSRAGQGAAYIFRRTNNTWLSEATLWASDPTAGGHFGRSIAISADTVAIGASGDSQSAGAAYAFKRAGSAWYQQARMQAPAPTSGDGFGSAVCVSGDLLGVGAPTTSNSAANMGAAYIFSRAGSVWSQGTQLAGKTNGGERFGTSIGISGSTIAVGAPGNSAGHVLVFGLVDSKWKQRADLAASDKGDGDNFGSSVSFSGNTLLIGAVNDTVAQFTAQGSAYVFTGSDATWTQQAHIFEPSIGASHQFGFAAAISGDIAVVGAPAEQIGTAAGQGAAWTFSRVGTSWIGPDMKLIAADGATADGFGNSVAINGNLAIIGAPNDNINGINAQGSAYVFSRAGQVWVQEAKLTASDGGFGHAFGSAVSISGSLALVGAASANNIGAAYVFSRQPTPVAWSQQAKLVPPAGGGGTFGSALALDGTTAVVGAGLATVNSNANQGAAYIYQQAADLTWPMKATLLAGDGAAYNFFGSSIALSGGTVIAGAWNANNQRGAAYVFTSAGTSWSQQARLTALGGIAGDNFGGSVGVASNTAVIGASGWSSGRGKAVVFTRSGSTWSQQANLLALDASPGDQFGSSVAVSGNTALIGALHANVNANTAQGAAYVFTGAGNSWSQQAKLTASDGAAADNFGRCVALSGSDFLIGSAHAQVGNNPAQGAAYLSNPAYNAAAFEYSDSPVAVNVSTGDIYTSLNIAIPDSNPGNLLSGTEAAWRTIASLDVGSIPNLSLTGFGDVRWPSSSQLTFRQNNTLSLTSGSTAQIFGTLVLLADSGLAADTLIFGSRSATRVYANTRMVAQTDTRLFGRMSVFQNATLTLDTPAARFDAHASLRAANPAVVDFSGSFDCAIDDVAGYAMGGATLRMHGNGVEQTFEAMSRDIGPTQAGLDALSPGNFPIGTLEIATGAVVRIVDSRDNDAQGQDACEAVYVDTLRINAGGRLINTGCPKVYYNTLINDGTVDAPANLIHLPPPCRADRNADGIVDLSDFFEFFNCWDLSLPCADVDANGMVDLLDFFAFFDAWDAGC